MTTKRAPLEGGNTTDMQSIQEALNHINPVDLNYDTWVRVGMALRSAGCTCGTWETWSSQDPERFHDGECEKKWDSFNSDGVGIATLFYLAKQGGWSPRDNCNDTRNLPDCSEFIRAISAQPKTPEEQLSTYLSSAFEPADQIRVVGNAYVDENGRLCFTKGTTRPRNDWMKILKNGGVDAVGPFNEFGGWCAVNPLDGKGVKAGNVTRFKHTLIECDEIPVDEQERLIRELKLPVTTLVHSGGKSIHALVRVDASNRQEYDERVKRLHEICKDARFNVDPACKDPGRLTRLPGVLRDCVLQRLLDTYIGCESWDSWIRHLEAPGVKFIPTKIAGSGPMPPPLFKNGPIPGALGLFIGEDGIGKGYVILDLLVSCVLGRPVNLQTICSQGKPMRVLYLCYEDMCPVLEWRLVRICEEAEISPELWRDAERQGLLTVKALPRQPEEEENFPPLFRQEEHGVPRFTEFFKALEHYLVEHQIRLCIIDPLAAAAELSNENDNASMNAVAVQLRSMAARTGCTIIMTHHTSKAAHGNQHHHAARGGSALPGAGRWQLQLSQENNDGPVYLSISKNSYGRRVFDVQLQREDNGVLREMTHKEMRDRACELMYEVIGWIKAHPDLVINHNAVKNKTGDAKYLVDAMTEALSARPKDVYDAIEAGRLNDLLEISETKYNRKLIQKVTVPGTMETGPAPNAVPEESNEEDEEIPFV